MQEIALILTGVAGAMTLGAIRRMPRKAGRSAMQEGISEEMDALVSEKEILEKAVSRLHESDCGVSKHDRERLLERYGERLGLLGRRMDAMDAAGGNPEIAALGDGLLRMMDRRLAGLDERLTEISSRLSSERRTAAPRQEGPAAQERKGKARQSKMELITLTSIPNAANSGEGFSIEQKSPPAVEETDVPVGEIATPGSASGVSSQSVAESPNKIAKSVAPAVIPDLDDFIRPDYDNDDRMQDEEKKTSHVQKSDVDSDAADDDDIKKITKQIEETLSRLSQAEVE